MLGNFIMVLVVCLNSSLLVTSVLGSGLPDFFFDPSSLNPSNPSNSYSLIEKV